MNRLIAILCSWVILSGNVLAGTYYIDYVGGLDSNSGTSKASPWKRSPGMAGFSGAYSHVTGDRFIYKGGVTWPTSCFQFTLNNRDGTSANWDYYGVDQTWFTGGSWTQPTWDFEHRTFGFAQNGSACYITGCDYVMFDNIRFLNQAAPIATGSEVIWGIFNLGIASCSNVTVTNCLFKDWWMPNTGGVIQTGKSTGGGVSVNGSSNILVTHSKFTQEGSEVRSGSAVWAMSSSTTIQYCEIWDCGSAVMSFGNIYHNDIHDLKDPSDSAAHSNAILTYGPGFRIAYNKIHDIASGVAQVMLLPLHYGGYTGAGGNNYVWDNIVWNCAQFPLVWDARDQYNVKPTTNYFWNNTLNSSGIASVRVGAGSRPVPVLEGKNNHFITTLGNPIQFDNTATILTLQNNLTNTPTVATSYGYVSGNLFAPTDVSDPTVGTGLDLSSRFTDDFDGTARTVPWDIGAHEWNGVVSGPGTIVMSATTASVSEGTASITLSAQRIGGSTGAVGCSYATANGTATSGVNYTSASGSLSWAGGDTATKTFTVTIIDANMVDNKTFTATLSSATGGATIGSPATTTVTITGTGTTAPPLLTGTTWYATNMMVVAPVYLTNGYAVQDTQISDPTTTGLLKFRFVSDATDRYTFSIDCVAATEANNSIYFTVNGVPTEPYDVSDIPVAPGVANRFINKRGNGTYADPEFRPYGINLTAGATNEVIVGAREAGVQIYSIRGQAAGSASVLAVYTPNTARYYRSGQDIDILVKFTDQIVVTGSPLFSLNNGGDGVFLAITNGTDAIFRYTISPGDDSETLDQVSTNAISLNGGTINSTNGSPASIVVPVPGQLGSLGAYRAIGVDTVAPTVTLSSPSPGVSQDGPITFAATYSDTHLDTISLNAGDVQVTATGSPPVAVGAVTVEETLTSTRYITLSGLSNTGTLTVSVPSGTAQDMAGNLCSGSAVSDPATVKQLSRIRALQMKAKQISKP